MLLKQNTYHYYHYKYTDFNTTDTRDASLHEFQCMLHNGYKRNIQRQHHDMLKKQGGFVIVIDTPFLSSHCMQPASPMPGFKCVVAGSVAIA